MALIRTTRRGRSVFIVRWNYRAKHIDGKPYDQREFSQITKARAWDREVGGTNRPGERSTIAILYHSWTDSHREAWAQNTHRGYVGIGKTHILPGIGKHRADKLTPRLVSEWMLRMRAEGVSNPTANKALRSLRAMLKWARGQGLTTCTAANDIKGPRQPAPADPVAYKTHQVEALAKACELLRDATAIRVAAATGLRRSELFALHWEDVGPRTLIVTRALDADRTFKVPKSHESRTVPILQFGRKALAAWAEHGQTGLVFPGPDGLPLNQRNWDRDILGRKTTDLKTKTNRDGIRIRTGIDLQMHQLRDTYASLMFAANVPLPSIQSAMGHESIETTLKHYRVYLPSSIDTDLDRVDALIATGRV